MEIFGAVAASVTLTAEFIRLGWALKRTFKSIKYARKEIRLLADEIMIFSGIFDTFLEAAEKNKNGGVRARSINKLIKWSKRALRGLGDLVVKVKVLALDRRFASVSELVDTVRAHVKWYFRRESVNCLRASMSVARESMNTILNLMCLEKLNEELEQLKTRAVTGEEIARLQRRIQVRKDLVRETNAMLKISKAKVLKYEEKRNIETFVPHTERLLELTSAVKEYKDEVLPSIQPNLGRIHRTRTSDQGIVTGQIPIVEEVETGLLSPHNHEYPQPRPTKLPSSFDDGSISSDDYFSSSSSAIPVESLPHQVPQNVDTNTSTSHMSSGRATSKVGKEYINDTSGDILAPPRRATAERKGITKTIRTAEESTDKTHQSAPDKAGASNGRTRMPNTPDIFVDKNITDDSLQERSSFDEDLDTEQVLSSDGPSPFYPLFGKTARLPPGWHKRNQGRRST